MSEFILVDGYRIRRNEKVFDINNSYLFNGEFVTEYMHFSFGKVQFFDYHINRIVESLRILNIVPPKEFEHPEILHNQIYKLSNRNRLYKGAVVKLTVFKSTKKTYDSTSQYIVEMFPLNSSKYVINKKGILTDTFEDVKKCNNRYASYLLGFNHIYIFAKKKAAELQLGEIFILNNSNKIIEAINYNIFVIKNNYIYTPPLDDGATDGIMRKICIDVLQKKGFKVINKSLTTSFVYEADEIFLTNVVDGIKWVVGFKDKRYYNKTVSDILDIVNKYTFDSDF